MAMMIRRSRGGNGKAGKTRHGKEGLAGLAGWLGWLEHKHTKQLLLLKLLGPLGCFRGEHSSPVIRWMPVSGVRLGGRLESSWRGGEAVHLT